MRQTTATHQVIDRLKQFWSGRVMAMMLAGVLILFTTACSQGTTPNASRLTNETSAKIERSVQAAKSTAPLEAGGETIEQASEQASQSLRNFGDGIADRTKQGMETLQQGTENAADTAKDLSRQAQRNVQNAGENLTQAAQRTAQDTTDMVQRQAQDAVKQTQRTAQEAADAVGGRA